VKNILLHQLCRRFEKDIFSKPEYFCAMVFNPITKSVLKTFPDDFLLSVTNAIQQDIGALSQSTTQTPPLSTAAVLRSLRKKKLWFLPPEPTTTSTTTTSVKNLVQEWMEHPIMHDDIVAVCCW
jgi:hypothetical protein